MAQIFDDFALDIHKTFVDHATSGSNVFQHECGATIGANSCGATSVCNTDD